MKALLENIDLYAYKINFNYKRQTVFHSYFGIGLSIIMYSVMIYFVQYFSRDFINKTNPRVIYKETEFDMPLNITLDKILKKVYLHIAIEFLFDEKVDFIFNAEKNNNTKKDTIELIEKIFVPFIQINENTQVLLHNGSLSYIYENETFECINEDLKGKKCKRLIFLHVYELKFENKKFNFLTVKKKEQNNSSNNKDNSSNKYNNFNNTNSLLVQINEFHFEISASNPLKINFPESSKRDSLQNFWPIWLEKKIEINDYIININNLDFFKQYDFRPLYSLFHVFDSKQALKYWEIEFNLVAVENDAGIVFSNITKEYSMQVKTQFDLNMIETNDFPIIIFSFNKVMKKYDRIYKKLQNVFADLGGLLNSLIMLGNIIIVQFNKRKFDYDLINLLYKADDCNDDNLKNSDDGCREFSSKQSVKDKSDCDFHNKNKNNDNNQKIKFYKENIELVSLQGENKLNNIIEDSGTANNPNANNYLKKVNEVNYELNKKEYFEHESINFNFNSEAETQRKQALRIGDELNLTSRYLNTSNNNNSSNASNIQDKFEKNFVIADSLKIKESNNNHVGKFEFPDDKNRSLEINDKQNKCGKNNKEYSANNFSEEELNKAELFIENFEKLKRKKFVKFSKTEFFKSFIFCKKFKKKELFVKEELLFAAEKKVYGYLDVLNYATLFEDFEKLKDLLLNEQQKNAFKFIINIPDLTTFTKEEYLSKILETAKYFNSKSKEDSENPYDDKMKKHFYKLFKNLYEGL